MTWPPAFLISHRSLSTRFWSNAPSSADAGILDAALGNRHHKYKALKGQNNGPVSATSGRVLFRPFRAPPWGGLVYFVAGAALSTQGRRYALPWAEMF